MSEPTQTPGIQTSPPLFREPALERGSFAKGAVFGSIAVVLVILGALLLASRGHHPVPVATILPLDPRSANLPLSGVAMSESTSLSGGKSTFIDGHIRNTGSQTITGITVQVLFRNDVGLAPQTEVLPSNSFVPVNPISTRNPCPPLHLHLKDERDFRLPFENINDNWNIQIPEIRVVSVTTK